MKINLPMKVVCVRNHPRFVLATVRDIAERRVWWKRIGPFRIFFRAYFEDVRLIHSR